MTVRNWRSRLIEKYQYITPDGLMYELHDPPARAVMSYNGDGFPPLTFEATRGPFQHGENVNSFRLNPRPIDIILRHQACSRDDYWTKRGTLTDFLRHSRTDANNPQPGQIRRILSNGDVRDFDVFLTDPPQFLYPKGWDFFAFHESFAFTAFNPIAYDPTLQTLTTVSFVPTTVEDLVFPFTAPFLFGITNQPVTKTMTINYLGNWEEYPTIVVQGPGSTISIVHQTTGAQIVLEGYTFGAAETITFNLLYGFKTVINNFGVSLLGYISDDSDLAQFNLLPDPLVPGGINKLDITVSNGDNSTSILVSYKNRYESVD